YKNLLGTPGGSKPKIWANCMFVDPIADVAILCEPDVQANEQSSQQSEAYLELTDNVPVFSLGSAPKKGRVWLLGLDGSWFPTPMEQFHQRLWLDATPNNKGGMSGSPILDDNGRAVSLLSRGSGRSGEPERSGPQPILAWNLPGWLARRASPGSRF